MDEKVRELIEASRELRREAFTARTTAGREIGAIGVEGEKVLRWMRAVDAITPEPRP